MTRGLRKNRQGEKTKAELLEAAGYVFSRKGYEVYPRGRFEEKNRAFEEIG